MGSYLEDLFIVKAPQDTTDPAAKWRIKWHGADHWWPVEWLILDIVCQAFPGDRRKKDICQEIAQSWFWYFSKHQFDECLFSKHIPDTVRISLSKYCMWHIFVLIDQ